MYIRDTHEETDLRVLRQLIRDHPLGLITTAISSPNFPLLQSSHIPFILDIEDESSETELGRLRCHLARANPHSKAIIEEATTKAATSTSPHVLEQDVLVIFTHPAHHYVTPKFFVETKPANGKVVPTWNYAAVQVYGKATVYVDSKSDETGTFLTQQIDALSQHGEKKLMGYTGQGGNPGPWGVSDAPERYIELLKKAIIGVEIKVDRMEGKFKMSQEMGDGDAAGVSAGFRRLDNETGRQVADMVDERRKPKT